MYNNFIKTLGVVSLLVLAGIWTSCEKEDNATSVENFVWRSITEIEESSGAGRAGCYELVFPVTLQFADGTTQEVEDYASLRQAIREWYEANLRPRPRPFNRPVLVLPFEVINEDGEVITVSTREELFALRRACAAGHLGHGNPGHSGQIRPCFLPVFPYTLAFPDGSEVTVHTPRELQQAIREWRVENPGATGHPEFVFPMTVRLQDGTEVVVNSPQELRALKAECRG